MKIWLRYLAAMVLVPATLFGGGWTIWKKIYSADQFSKAANSRNIKKADRLFFWGADTEPWKQIKTNEERTGTILNLALQIAANLSILCEPFLPRTSVKISDLLNLEGMKWIDAGSDVLLTAGQKLEKAELLFDKIEDKAVEEQILKLKKILEHAKKLQSFGSAP